MGTSIKEHGVNTSVIDISERQEIPNPDAKTWYKLTDSAPSDGLGLQNAGTIQSNFLLEKPTFIKT